MTRTADQTLLARYGFNDPDKSNPEHDLACRFLCEPEWAAKVLALGLPGLPEAYFRYCGQQPTDDAREGVRFPSEVRLVGSIVEAPIIKGDRQFVQYVGFADAAIGGRAVISQRRSEQQPGTYANGKHTRPAPIVSWEDLSLDVLCGVEVKVRPYSVSDALRQIKFYGMFGGGMQRPPGIEQPIRLPWVLATRYDLSKADVKLLRHEGILHVRLGRGFEAFAEQVRASEKSDSPEL